MSVVRGARTLPSGAPRPRYDQEALLEAAVEVFTQRGYDGASMEQLARATGLSKSSLYHHVTSKEQLLRLALERALDPLLAVLDESPARKGRAADRLRHVIRREVDVLSERLPYVTLLLRVRGNTATECWALEQRRAFDRRVAGLVQMAIDEGDVRADVDAKIAARLVFGMVNSLVEWHRPMSRRHGPQVAEQIVALVFDGLRA